MKKRLQLLSSLLLLIGIGIGTLSLGFFAIHSVQAVGQSQLSKSSGHGRTLVLVGGALADNNSAIYGKIVDQAGGKGVARIGIITAASIPESQDPFRDTPQASNSEDNGLFYANLFKTKYGVADAQWIPIDTDNLHNNSSPAVLKQINSMTGFFFGGGDQSRLLFCLYLTNPYNPNRVASPALKAITAKYDAGAVVAGTSAGTDAQAQAAMITGGVSYDGIKYGSFPYLDPFNTNNLTYNPVGGFGFFTYGLLDAHFSQRGREGRLIRLAADTHTPMAYGIDENTALFITNADTPQAQMQIIGQNGAYILDLTQAQVKYSGKFWNIYGVKITYLTPGDRYAPATKTATIASFKTPLAGHEHHKQAITTNDIFDSFRNNGTQLPEAFTAVSTYLFDSLSTSTYGTTFEQNPAWEVLMTKESDSAGYEGTIHNVTYISYVNLNVDIFVVK